MSVAAAVEGPGAATAGVGFGGVGQRFDLFYGRDRQIDVVIRVVVCGGGLLVQQVQTHMGVIQGLLPGAIVGKPVAQVHTLHRLRRRNAESHAQRKRETQKPCSVRKRAHCR